jgi:hypothetical protein
MSANGSSTRDGLLAGSFFHSLENSVNGFKKLLCAFKRETDQGLLDVAEQIEVPGREVTRIWRTGRRFHLILLKELRWYPCDMRTRIIRMHHRLSLAAICFN